jgi:3-carboxy-cis,cis-muconate cycloisomerase
VARDCLAQWGLQAAALCATCARLAREIINLSRNEIAEVSEQTGHLRGASSTMPQKANPVSSEVLVGLSVTAGALASGLLRTMEAGHDRAAGEWQAEWQLLPLIAAQAAAALGTAVDLVANLQVFPATMRANLDVDHGLVMAEAYMIGLAETLGRETAHELVYAAARNARSKGISLFDAVRAELPDELTGTLTEPLAPENYLGEVDRLVDVAVADWRAAPVERS